MNRIQSSVTKPDSPKTNQLVEFCDATSTFHSITILIEVGDVVQAFPVPDGLTDFAGSLEMSQLLRSFTQGDATALVYCGDAGVHAKYAL